MRDFGGVASQAAAIDGAFDITSIPKWARHDPNVLVMKDGKPVTVGTIIYHHNLLSDDGIHSGAGNQYTITPTWRLRERMKTVGVCLVLALNIGTDPPDLVKPTPCAKLQCWLDPTSISRLKAKERIGERLEQQYAKWQQRSKLKYRRALDPTVSAVKDLCIRMRESAKNERVLFHFNGQGTPRPTANGEIWLFDKHHTNYIPLSVCDLRRWIGKPSIVVLDCSGAGVLMPYFTQPLLEENTGGYESSNVPYIRSSSAITEEHDSGGAEYLKPIRDTIVLCPTAQGEWLPLNYPELPADLFTSCLTTPIQIALRWFVFKNPLSTHGLDIETVADSIPGKLTDRKTPLGELNWIFTAITDTIAFNVLPSQLFMRLFRQDLLLASLFRNFLLAERILKTLGCTPMTYPELPSTFNHPLWDAWDLAVEQILLNHIKRSNDSLESTEEEVSERRGGLNIVKSPSLSPPPPDCGEINTPFFAEQLTAFEIWLEYAASKPKNQLVIKSPPNSNSPLPFLQSKEDSRRAMNQLDPPQELPIVLQVLLSQAHRVRALVLLRRFLALGPSAVNLALSVGIFPYVLKLLQSPINEYRSTLIEIWCEILAFDATCQADILKDKALKHFVVHLQSVESPTRSPTHSYEQQIKAMFIICVICNNYPLGQNEAVNERVHMLLDSLLLQFESHSGSERSEAEIGFPAMHRMWLCICLGNIAKSNTTTQGILFEAGLHLRLFSRLEDDSPDVRAAACYALGHMISIETKKSTVHSHKTPPSFPQAARSPSPAGAPLLPMPVGATPGQLLPQAVPGIGSTSGGQHQQNMPPFVLTPPLPRPEPGSSAFVDEQRLELDLAVGVKLASLIDDVSPLVRLEALIVINRIIGKYKEAFTSIVGNKMGGQQARNDAVGAEPSTQVPKLPAVAEEKIEEIWARLFALRHQDPFPQVQLIVNQIVVLVNERVLNEKNRIRQLSRTSQHRPDTLAEEETSTLTSISKRTATSLNLSTAMSSPPRRALRPTSSATSFTIGTPTPPVAAAPLSPTRRASHTTTSLSGRHADSFAIDVGSVVPAEGDYPLLESMFFAWKAVEFGQVSSSEDNNLDPLSDQGAMSKYRRVRNDAMFRKSHIIKNTFAVLAEGPARVSRFGGYAESDAAAGLMEREVEEKKNALQLQEAGLFKIKNFSSTSLLSFHSFEPALIATGNGYVNVYNAETNEHMVTFPNGSKCCQVTSCSWLNDESNSLLLAGGADGKIRVFDGLFLPNDGISREKPSLVSSFVAAPEIATETRYTSGLVSEWQQLGGRLFVGGNSAFIRLYDLAAEKCINSFNTKSETCSVTTLATAWQKDISGYSGLGPDVIIAGYGNGSVRLFDARSNNGELILHSSGEGFGRQRRKRYTTYSETGHNSWVVDLSFRNYGSRQEIVSGCVEGNIKFFDLRYREALRTIDHGHKMQMTALSSHSKIPMIAAGSPSQYIKIMSYDGLTNQMIRFHRDEQRIGPVSSLTFHPHLPFLAAGFADGTYCKCLLTKTITIK